MNDIQDIITGNENVSDPLCSQVIEFLMSKGESAYLDYKQIISVAKDSDFPEIAKDIFAFSNYGGGWIFIGWAEHQKNQFIPVGLPDDFHLDQSVLQEKFNSYSEEPQTLEYIEFTKNFKDRYSESKEDVQKQVNLISNRFAVIFIPSYYKILVPKKDGTYQKSNRERIVFKKGDIFYRRGTSSIKPPSELELSLIKQRLEKENYRLSVLSGEPDEIPETLISNLFEITKLPKYIYYAKSKKLLKEQVSEILKSYGIFPDFLFKFKEWSNLILTFEDLNNENSPYRNLVDETTIYREQVDEWLNKEDNRKLIVELLNNELVHHLICNGLFYFYKRDMFYYDPERGSSERTIKWVSPHRVSTRVVTTQMYAEQLGKVVFIHSAFIGNIIQIGNKFYLRIIPTMTISEDGRRIIYGQQAGSIITRLTYDTRNAQHLNNIRFWIYQLGNGKNITIKDYLVISNKPVQITSNIGILQDHLQSKFKDDGSIGDNDLIIAGDGVDGI